MPGNACVVCGNSRKKEPLLSYHRFPSNPEKRALWLRVFQLSEHQLKKHYRICSRHFPGGDPRNKPELCLGKRFASPVKKGDPRTKRAKLLQYTKDNLETLSAASSRSVTPLSSQSPPALHLPPPMLPLTVKVGERSEVDYQVHELPGKSENTPETTSACPSATMAPQQNLISAALLARIKVLEAENARLKKCLSSEETYFGMEQIIHDDHLVSFTLGSDPTRYFWLSFSS